MAKNICPKCHEVILTLRDESVISCIKCETVFNVGNGADEDSSDKNFRNN